MTISRVTCGTTHRSNHYDHQSCCIRRGESLAALRLDHDRCTWRVTDSMTPQTNATFEEARCLFGAFCHNLQGVSQIHASTNDVNRNGVWLAGDDRRHNGRILELRSYARRKSPRGSQCSCDFQCDTDTGPKVTTGFHPSEVRMHQSHVVRTPDDLEWSDTRDNSGVHIHPATANTTRQRLARDGHRTGLSRVHRNANHRRLRRG